MMQFGALPHSFLSVGLKHREAKQQRVVTCEAAPRKGFGGGEDKKKKKNVKKQQQQEGKVHNKRAVAVKEGSRQLQNVLRNVDKETAAQQQKKLGIDPGMAAQGKVDFVRVEAWGQEGTEAELENLKLKSFSPAFSFKEEDNNVPFYEQLVRRLQLLESKGELAVAQAKPLPPFERWSFGEERYLQFLQDQLAVYRSLKDAVAAVKSSRDTVASDNVEDVENRASLAVAVFDSTLGLDRHEELAADIQALSEATTRIGMALEIRPPTTQTNAYVKVIEHIGRSAASESAEGCLRLLAHIFAIHVAHLTIGMRVGAKAVECLSLLKEARAVHFYRDYPKQAQDPLRTLIAALNTAGSYLVRPEEREQVMQELPKAIQRTSLFLSVLAVEKQQQL